MNRWVIAIALLVIFLWYRSRRAEAYSVRDTRVNIADRVAGFFDKCSPENLEDCKRGRTGFEGLPLA